MCKPHKRSIDIKNCSSIFGPACPIGTYGRGCKQVCQCRTVQQCNKTTGVCTCGVGYTGTFCNATCPSLWYGVDCQQRCQCYVAGTAICGRFDGRCNCGAGWTGTLCDGEGGGREELGGLGPFVMVRVEGGRVCGAGWSWVDWDPL